MKNQNGPSLLALSALLLCTFQQPAGSHRSGSASSSSSSSSSSEVRGRSNEGTAQNGLGHTNCSWDGDQSLERPSAKLKETPEHVGGLNSSRGGVPAVTSGRSSRTPGWIPGDREERGSPVCAYRVMEGGIGGQLCFRNTLTGYKCHAGDCRKVVSVGNLVANILTNGSVMLQWSRQEAQAKQNGANQTRGDTPPSSTVFSGRRHRRGGYELSCWWNGSYTQFECAGVHLGSGCTDFLLTDLHENIPYRLCLRPLAESAVKWRDCVEFTLPSSGMQDIVIAMTTVGGAICVMLVIICLLVAYITENIMSPSTQHTYSYRTHSRH